VAGFCSPFSSYECYNICFIKAIIQNYRHKSHVWRVRAWCKVRDYVVLYIKFISQCEGVSRELQRNSQKLPFIVQLLNHFLSYIKNSNSRKFTLVRGYCLPQKSPLRYFLLDNAGKEVGRILQIRSSISKDIYFLLLSSVSFLYKRIDFRFSDRATGGLRR